MKIEYKDEAMNYIEDEDAYDMQSFKGIAEFAIADIENYDVSMGQLPYLRFHSHVKEEEMMPLPEQYTLKHHEVFWELERWSLFQSLPNLVKFDGSVRHLLK